MVDDARILRHHGKVECDPKRLPEQLQPYCALDNNVAPDSGDGEIEVLSETRVLIWPEGASERGG